MKRLLIPLVAVFYALLSSAGSISEAQGVTWVRGYPSEGNPAFGMTAGCVYYVAEWSDGSYTSVPWDCDPGVVARDAGRTSNRGYPQRAANGCVEYVTQWSDGSYNWVPFECPPGVPYPKPPPGPLPLRPNMPAPSGLTVEITSPVQGAHIRGSDVLVLADLDGNFLVGTSAPPHLVAQIGEESIDFHLDFTLASLAQPRALVKREYFYGSGQVSEEFFVPSGFPLPIIPRVTDLPLRLHSTSWSFQITELPAGTYVLTVEAVDRHHLSFEPAVKDEVVFTVN